MVNVSLTEMIQKHIDFDPEIFDLAELGAVDRKQITVNDVLQPLGFHSEKSMYSGIYGISIGLLFWLSWWLELCVGLQPTGDFVLPRHPLKLKCSL